MYFDGYLYNKTDPFLNSPVTQEAGAVGEKTAGPCASFRTRLKDGGFRHGAVQGIADETAAWVRTPRSAPDQIPVHHPEHAARCVFSLTLRATRRFVPCGREGRAMTSFSNTFGLALRNFTTWPELPDPRELIDYAARAEALGFDSVWVWDHILPGSTRRSRSARPADLARRRPPPCTSTIKLGTGVWRAPSRNPVVLAKELSSLDLIADGRPAGWRSRAGKTRIRRGRCAVPRARAARWTATSNPAPAVDRGSAERGIPAACSARPRTCRQSRHLPPILIGGYVYGASNARRWNGGCSTHFDTPEGLPPILGQGARLCRGGGKSSTPCSMPNQLAIYVGRLAGCARAGDYGLARPGMGLRVLEPVDQVHWR